MWVFLGSDEPMFDREFVHREVIRIAGRKSGPNAHAAAAIERIVAMSNARNVKRSGAKKVVGVLRPRP